MMILTTIGIIVLSVLTIFGTLFMVDLIANNYKKPIFVILVVVALLHMLAIAYIPIELTPPSKQLSTIDVILEKPKIRQISWESMLVEQNKGLPADIIYTDCGAAVKI